MEALETKLLLGKVSHGLAANVPGGRGVSPDAPIATAGRPDTCCALAAHAGRSATSPIRVLSSKEILITVFDRARDSDQNVDKPDRTGSWSARSSRTFPDGPSRWFRATSGIWAPDVVYFGGEYYLYYAVSTFGSDRSVIGLATNATLDPNGSNYDWVDQGEVIASIPGRTNWNAIDPDPVVVDGSQLWLAFGSQWSGIKLTPDRPADRQAFQSKARAIRRRVKSPNSIRSRLVRHRGRSKRHSYCTTMDIIIFLLLQRLLHGSRQHLRDRGRAIAFDHRPLSGRNRQADDGRGWDAGATKRRVRAGTGI